MSVNSGLGYLFSGHNHLSKFSEQIILSFVVMIKRNPIYLRPKASAIFFIFREKLSFPSFCSWHINSTLDE